MRGNRLRHQTVCCCPPIQVTVNLSSFHPDGSQLIAILYGFAGSGGICHLLLAQGCRLLRTAAFFLLPGFFLGPGLRQGSLFRSGTFGRQAGFLLPLTGDPVGMQHQRRGHCCAGKQQNRTQRKTPAHSFPGKSFCAAHGITAKRPDRPPGRSHRDRRPGGPAAPSPGSPSPPGGVPPRSPDPARQ